MAIYCPSSCDTFVALPPATGGGVIFGKNSDRPNAEVQELIYSAAADHDAGSTVQCTYIEIPQVPHAHAAILSKPAWCWGAEMGANEHGVCIGNEAVWTKSWDASDREERLLGMDIVRLGIERSRTAREAVDIMTTLLSEYGQGGPCFEEAGHTDRIYENSFIIADGTEAWVLETTGKHWAADKVTEGVRNISNQLSIGSRIDLMSEGLKEHAQSQGLWNPGDGDFDFAKAFGLACPWADKLPENERAVHRFSCGKDLMETAAKEGFSITSMMNVLRDEASGVCRTGVSGAVSAGSQVSIIQAPRSASPSCHFFTATPNPARSVFKPFIFTPNVSIGTLTKSPDFGADDPVKTKPRFQKTVDRQHPLYKAQAKVNPMSAGNNGNQVLLNTLRSLEDQCVSDIESFLASSNDVTEELGDLFKDVVESEIKFYRKK